MITSYFGYFMCNSRHRDRIGPLTALVLLCLVAGPTLADTSWPAATVRPEAIVRDRVEPVVAAGYQSFFDAKADRPVAIWVLFTDKGISNKAGFQQTASSLVLTERARIRRAKVGRAEPIFADLPVLSSYVERVQSTGATLRRTSRWLNAASFELPASQIAEVATLRCVAEIRPVGRARTVIPEVEEARPESDQTLQSSEYDLDYGLSLAQLEQLNVPAVHDLGYSGAGILLGLLDTGFRQSHLAFAAQIAEGRLVAQHDFVYNDGNVDEDPGDWASETSHGTRVWSVAAGAADGELYGPGYGCDIVLCKTEDVRSETNVEEDNWVAGIEYCDSIGVDVISTSLGYFTFDDTCNCDYTYEDMDGLTAISSAVASTCDGLGIVLVKSAGNSGPSAGSITAPADGRDILAVGSVYNTGLIVSSSSRGPTYDGRIKPEVCARGAQTRAVHPTTDNLYMETSGTSFAAPLIGGAVCLVIEAHPEWTPHQVREALKASGNYAHAPNNDYGWGIVDILAAINSDPSCCAHRVGDANMSLDDEPTIGDVSIIVDAKYITNSCDGTLNCLPEADINQSGGLNPTCDDISIGDISLLVDYLFITGPESSTLNDCL